MLTNIFRLGKPRIPPKEGFYIARGHMKDGSVHTIPKFAADFYVPKPFVLGSLEPQNTFRDLFIKSVRKFKKETDREFEIRCSKKFGEHYIFYYHEDDLWYWNFPREE